MDKALLTDLIAGKILDEFGNLSTYEDIVGVVESAIDEYEVYGSVDNSKSKIDRFEDGFGLNQMY